MACVDKKIFLSINILVSGNRNAWRIRRQIITLKCRFGTKRFLGRLVKQGGWLGRVIGAQRRKMKEDYGSKYAAPPR